MADTKISGLPASTTPLAGTEVLPIVQSGVTKQVSVANLTAGRALSATEITLSTGNLVIGTSGKGIDFSATPGTGTSELLSDYEEGTWTPVYNTVNSDLANFAPFLPSGKYTKIGNVVTVYCNIATQTAASISGTGRVIITGLPFAPVVGAGGVINFVALTSDNRFANNPTFGNISVNQTTVNLYKTNAMNTANALLVTDFSATNSANFNLLSFCVTYHAA
jgi:hypothetical protein